MKAVDQILTVTADGAAATATTQVGARIMGCPGAHDFVFLMV